MGKLIIVSDGCEMTNCLYKSTYEQYDNIQLLSIPKQPLFSGKVRQTALDVISTGWVCYLDTDDEFGMNHLKNLSKQLDSKYDWMYFNDYKSNGDVRATALQIRHIGTSCIIHKSTVTAVWPDGYDHDWKFIQQLGPNAKRIDSVYGYIVHHVPNGWDT